MADIKVKEVRKKTIKTLDKGVIATERLKDTCLLYTSPSPRDM